MSTTSAGQPAVTETERAPLSLNQEFVCLFDSGGQDGPFGPHYHIVEAWRVTGHVDAVAMRRALRQAVPTLRRASPYPIALTYRKCAVPTHARALRLLQ